MGARNARAGRLLAGLFGLFFSMGLVAKSIGALSLALRLRAGLANHLGQHLEVQEAFITFALLLMMGLAAGWWGLAKFRQ